MTDEWLQHVRHLASEAKLMQDGFPMLKRDIEHAFNYDTMAGYYEEGMTPQKALETELQYWADAPS